jgi:hypothetical protein
LLTGEIGMSTIQMLAPAGRLDGFNSAAKTLERVRARLSVCAWQQAPALQLLAAFTPATNHSPGPAPL